MNRNNALIRDGQLSLALLGSFVLFLLLFLLVIAAERVNFLDSF